MGKDFWRWGKDWKDQVQKKKKTISLERRKYTYLVLNYSQELRQVLNLAEDIPIEFTAHGESPAKVAAALAAASLEENAAAAAATPAAADADAEAEVKTEEVSKTEA